MAGSSVRQAITLEDWSGCGGDEGERVGFGVKGQTEQVLWYRIDYDGNASYASPYLTNYGVQAEIVLEDDGNWTGSVRQWIGGIEFPGATLTPGSEATALPGTFSVLVDDLTVRVFWRDNQIGTLTLDQWTTQSATPQTNGGRIGLGIDCTQDRATGSRCLVNWYTIEYESTGLPTKQRSKGIISAGGTLYQEAWLGRYSSIANNGSITLPADKLTLAAQRGGVLYIADPTAIRTYTPLTDTMATLTASAGSVPTGCPLINVYRDRLVVSGQEDGPGQWFMSKQGDFTAWDYSLLGPGDAVSGATNAAGLIGEPILATASWLDDFFLFGCTNSLWVLKGDPSYGGKMFNLSTRVGIVDMASHCFGPSGEFIFLTSDGLYFLEPNPNSTPKSISREKLPQELRHVDKGTFTILMAYDFEYRGIHLYLTGERGTRKHWWVTWPEGTFWPVALQGNGPTAIQEFKSYDPIRNAVLLGNGTGDKYSDDAHDDKGSEIVSYAEIGPLRPSGDDYNEGKLDELWAILADGSGDVTWSVKSAATPSGTLDATAQATGTWVAGTNGREHPRVRGMSILLRLENGDTNQRWAMESIGAIMSKAGKYRIP